MRKTLSISSLLVLLLASGLGGACFNTDSSEDPATGDAGPIDDAASDGSGPIVDARSDTADAAPDAAADTTADSEGDAVPDSGPDAAGCDPDCTAPEGTDRVVAECESGSCQLRCEDGWVDTDDDFENGCELECEETNGGTEICDGDDNDCDGMIDEEFMTGECTVGTGACEASGTYQCVADDEAECDVEAGAPSDETCGDNIDNDCDGDTDEGDAVDATTWYADDDGDGFGDVADTKDACQKPSGYVANNEDCDDGDAMVKPRPFYRDRDGDGFTTTMTETKCTDSSAPSGFATSKSSEIDCDDGDPDVNPGQAEKCDGKDTNCDGTTDNISQNSSKGDVYYIDCDGDSFAPGTAGSVRACSRPGNPPSSCSTSNPSWTTKVPTSGDKTDCNDDAPKARPDQTNYFETETKNAGSDSLDKWDYDCDGTLNKRWSASSCGTTGLPTDCSCSGISPDGGGFGRDVSCGTSANFYTCTCENKTSCLPDLNGQVDCQLACGSSTTKTQTCR